MLTPEPKAQFCKDSLVAQQRHAQPDELLLRVEPSAEHKKYYMSFILLLLQSVLYCAMLNCKTSLVVAYTCAFLPL